MSPSPQPSSPPPPPNLITPHRATRWPAQTATSLAVSPGHPQHPQKRVSRRSRFLVRYSIRIILSCALAAIGLVSLVSTSGPTDALTVWPFASRVDLDLRARQASQLEFLHAGGSMGYLRDLGRDHNMLMLDHLGECLRGETRCPERPIILSNYNYIGFLYEGYTPPGGEMIWLGSALEYMEEAGYLVLHVHETSNWVAMSKIIPDLVYQYWTEDVRAISCIFDPKCIAQSEYTVPEDDPYHSVELSDVERGVIPHARLMPVSFWGNFPLAWGNGRGSAYGFTGDGYWTYNPLGTQWTLTPYAYPNNSHIPWSIEKVCMKTPHTPREDRQKIAVIYAKYSRLIRGCGIPHEFWDSDVVHDLEFKFVSTATEDNGIPIPEGLETLGLLTMSEFDELLGSSQVVVGLGTPKISPSVFSSLCQGTPVVLPMFSDYTDDDEGRFWGLRYNQHPIAAALGPPYVHLYQLGNATSLLEAVEEARKVSFDPYIPPFMKESYVRQTIRNFLATDFVAMAEGVVRANGGRIPTQPEYLRLQYAPKVNERREEARSDESMR